MPLRIARQPKANLTRLGVMRIKFENLNVMFPRFRWLLKLLRVKIGERKVRAGVVRIFLQQFFEFLCCPGEVLVLFKRPREIVARIQ